MTSIRFYPTPDLADQAMQSRNRAARAAGNLRDLWVVVDGPADDYAVVDLATAINLDAPYYWRT